MVWRRSATPARIALARQQETSGGNGDQGTAGGPLGLLAVGRQRPQVRDSTGGGQRRYTEAYLASPSLDSHSNAVGSNADDQGHEATATAVRGSLGTPEGDAANQGRLQLSGSSQTEPGQNPVWDGREEHSRRRRRTQTARANLDSAGDQVSAKGESPKDEDGPKVVSGQGGGYKVERETKSPIFRRPKTHTGGRGACAEVQGDGR